MSITPKSFISESEPFKKRGSTNTTFKKDSRKRITRGNSFLWSTLCKIIRESDKRRKKVIKPRLFKDTRGTNIDKRLMITAVLPRERFKADRLSGFFCNRKSKDL